MNDVNVLARDDFAEVLVAFDIRVHLFESILKVLLIHVAYRKEF